MLQRTLFIFILTGVQKVKSHFTVDVIILFYIITILGQKTQKQDLAPLAIQKDKPLQMKLQGYEMYIGKIF